MWEIELEAYGKVKSCSGEKGAKGDEGFIPFRFQGQYHDQETGMYYNRFRYYSPEEGMYVTAQDPIGLDGGSRMYAYVYNPGSWVDVLGLAHGLATEIIRNGEVIFNETYTSGGVFTGKGSPNQQQALLTHTERKFFSDAIDIVEPGDHLKMVGELNPCKPGCQPAIRDFVLKQNVTAEYHATSTNRTYHWEKVSDSHVIQTEMVNGKVVAKHRYNLETRKRVKCP